MLDGARLNTARFTSVLADIQAQFPITAGLLPDEKAMLMVYQMKMAHAVADHEGSDVVLEITGHAQVPVGIHVSTAGNATSQSGTTDSIGTII